MPKKQSKAESSPFVAAIDIGSAFSSYAFAKKSDVNNSHIIVKHWDQESRVGLSRKAPTSLLLRTDGTLKAFGYDAEKRYLTLRSGEKKEHMFFKHIKIHLAKEYARGDWKIPDEDGKPFSLKQLFVHTIRYLKDEVLKDICSDYPEVTADHVTWMVSIPAIWTDCSKYFMRDATEIAGIPQRNMTLVLEPEAAAIHCANKMELLKDNKFTPMQEGTQFILADLGGCTIDISVQEVAKNGRMRLLMPPVGIPRGGIDVDHKFEELLCSTFGREAIETFKNAHKHLYTKLLREFEFQKRQTKGQIRLTLPNKLKTIYEELQTSTILYSRQRSATPESVSGNDSQDYYTASTISDSSSDGKIENRVDINVLHTSVKYSNPSASMTLSANTRVDRCVGTSSSLDGSEDNDQTPDAQVPCYTYIDEENEEIVFSRGIFDQLFREIVENVLEELHKVTENEKCKKIKLIIMVGGLAESDIIYRAVKFEFASGFQIYRPDDADLVVLKGAVHLGLDPLAVMSRISRFTYGIRVFEVFDHRIHLEEKMVQRNGRYVCKDVYSKKFTIGETVEVGSVTQFKVFDTFIPDREDKRVDPLRVEIYVSELKEPRYTTDDTCKKLCSIIIEPYDDKWPVTVKGLVTFEVARSELIATFRDINTQRTAKCKFDFM